MNLENQLFLLSLLIMGEEEGLEGSLDGGWDCEVGGGPVEERLMVNMPILSVLNVFETLCVDVRGSWILTTVLSTGGFCGIAADVQKKCEA